MSASGRGAFAAAFDDVEDPTLEQAVQQPSRPSALRLVADRQRWARASRWLGTVTMVAVGLALVGLAVFHAVIVENQGGVDGSDQQLATLRADNDSLRLELASLESPDRIVGAAKTLGMVEAPSVTYLAPPSDLLDDQTLLDAVGPGGLEP